MMNLCTAQWWWLLPITAVVGWLVGNAVVLGVFVLRQFARRATMEKRYANGDLGKPVSAFWRGPLRVAAGQKDESTRGAGPLYR